MVEEILKQLQQPVSLVLIAIIAICLIVIAAQFFELKWAREGLAEERETNEKLRSEQSQFWLKRVARDVAAAFECGKAEGGTLSATEMERVRKAAFEAGKHSDGVYRSERGQMASSKTTAEPKARPRAKVKTTATK